jgi:hypothetical protein
MRSLVAAACAALVTLSPAGAAELIVNGSFNQAGAPGSTAGRIADDLAYGSVKSANLSTGDTYITGWNVFGDADIAAQVWWYNDGRPDRPDNQRSGDFNCCAWSMYGPLNGNNNGFTLSPDGGPVLELDGGKDYRGGVFQAIPNLTIGQRYTVRFYWGGGQQSCCGGTTTEQVQVSFSEPGGVNPQFYNTEVWNNPERGW